MAAAVGVRVRAICWRDDFPQVRARRAALSEPPYSGHPGAHSNEELGNADFVSRVPTGARIAIGVGSRGISNLATIVKSVVDFWKEQGARPFLFPAMGSHGAATAEGQADVLAHYGIDEATMGVPVVSSLDVVSVGKTAEGMEVFMDKNAYQSDAVFLVGRVKWHTDFSGAIESGLCKMMAIGLGKLAGARQYHTFAYRIGLEQVIRSVGAKVLETGKVLGGLAVLEGALPRDGGTHRREFGAGRERHVEARRGVAADGQILDGQVARTGD